MRKLIAVFVFLLSSAPICFCRAQGPNPGAEIQFKWWADQKIVSQVGISADQVRTIETLWTGSRKELVDLKAEIDSRHKELHSLFEADAVDEQVYGEKLDRLYRLRADLEKKILHFRLGVRNVMTPDQRKKLHDVMVAFRKSRPDPPPDRPPQREPKGPPPKN